MIEQVWDEHAGHGTNVVRVALSKLRAKLGLLQVIATVSGHGYRIGGPV